MASWMCSAFPLLQRILPSIFCRADLVVKNFFSFVFCVMENFFFLLQLWQIVLLGIIICAVAVVDIKHISRLSRCWLQLLLGLRFWGGEGASAQGKILTSRWIALKWPWRARAIFVLHLNRVFLSRITWTDLLLAPILLLLSNTSYFKKYIVIMKAPIVPLYGPPNILFHPLQNLILDRIQHFCSLN